MINKESAESIVTTAKLVRLANRAHDRDDYRDFEMDISYLCGAIEGAYGVGRAESWERYQATQAVRKWRML